MSQQLQSAPHIDDVPVQASKPQAEDPLAELARIVAGGEILPSEEPAPVKAADPQPDVTPAPASPDDAFMEDLETALAHDLHVAEKVPAETAQPSELAVEPIQPVEEPVAPSPVDDMMDLESQLMAELGGGDPIGEEPGVQPIDVQPLEQRPQAVETSPIHSITPDARDIAQVSSDSDETIQPITGEETNVADASLSVTQDDTVTTSQQTQQNPEVMDAPAEAPQETPDFDLDFGAAFDAQIAQTDPTLDPASASVDTEPQATINNPFGDNPFAPQETESAPTSADPIAIAVAETDAATIAIEEQQQLVEQAANTLINDDIAVNAPLIDEAGLEDAFADAFTSELERQGQSDVAPADLPEPATVQAEVPVEVSALAPQDGTFMAEPVQTPAAVEEFSIDEFENAFAKELDMGGIDADLDEASAQATMFEAREYETGDAQPEIPVTAPVTVGEMSAPEKGQEAAIDPSLAAAQSSTPTGLRPALGALALALMAGAGIVAYGYFSADTPTTGEPELIKAEVGDYKQKPQDPGGKEIANQDQPVYDALSGKATDEKVQEKLVSDTQEPVKVARSVETTPVKSDERLNPGDDVAENSNSPTTIMKPRRVKTVTVRPDGSLVLASNTTQDAVSGSGLAPMVATPPKPSDGAVEAASIDGAVSTGKLAVPTTNPVPLPAPVETALVADKQESAAEQATRSLVTPTPVKVEPKPVVAEPVSLGEPQPVEKPQPVATTVATAGQYVVQISSQRSLEAAQATYQNLNRRFSSILSGRPVDIKEAKVEGKGTFYRVRVPIGSKQAAAQFCGRYKGAGGSCFVTR